MKTLPPHGESLNGAPGRNRTYGLLLRREPLYPLSYERVMGSVYRKPFLKYTKNNQFG